MSKKRYGVKATGMHGRFVLTRDGAYWDVLGSRHKLRKIADALNKQEQEGREQFGLYYGFRRLQRILHGLRTWLQASMPRAWRGFAW